MTTVSSVITSIKSFLTSKYLALTGGKMSGGIEREGTAISWKDILDANKKSSCGLYQSTYNGYMPMLNMMTTDGRVGLGTYQNYLRMTYFLNTNTTNTPDNYLHFDSSGATVNGKPIACVTMWKSGKNWYRIYTDGFIEQGGYDGTDFSGSTGRTITFNTSMTTVCNVIPVLEGKYTSNSTGVTNVTAVTTTTFTVKGSNGVTNSGVYWYACGY